jgi:hypothetical protein
MAAPMLMGRDAGGYTTYALVLNAKDAVQGVENVQTTLSDSVVQTTTVPTFFEIYQAVFSYEIGTDVWVACNDTATLPGGAFTVTSSQKNPAVRTVNAGDVLSFITNNTSATLGVSYYGIP